MEFKLNINVDTGLMGDAICALPALQYLIKQENEKGNIPNIHFANKHVKKLIPSHFKYNIIEPIEEYDYVFNASKAWNAGIFNLHMMQAHFKANNLPVPTVENMKPEINITHEGFVKLTVGAKLPEDETFDFLISPFSRSDGNNNKLIPLDRWQKVIDYLNEKGYKVGVLCQTKDYNYLDIDLNNKEIISELNDIDKEVFTGVTYVADKSFDVAAGYIKDVKIRVLSIDNGVSHLVHCVGSPHLLFYPFCLPKTWVTNTNKNAVVIQDHPINFTSDRMIEFIEKNFLTNNK